MKNYIPSDDQVIHETRIDLGVSNIAPTINIMQYDRGLSVIKVELLNNNKEYIIPDDAKANIRVQKPDGKLIYNPALGVDSKRKNVLYFEIDEQLSISYGTVRLVVELYFQNGAISTSIINLNVNKNPVQQNDIQSVSEYKEINKIALDVRDNAAKAKQSELNAKESELNAKESETNALTSEQNSLQYKNDAKQSEDIATSSASSASESATQASSSKTSAQGYADSAKTNADATKALYDELKEYIPAEAGSSNKLADKQFVQNIVATNTAYFIGTFGSLDELKAYTGEKSNNDFAYVKVMQTPATTFVDHYDRYRYRANGNVWVYEYSIDNPTFSAEQWDILNNGATKSYVDGQIKYYITDVLTDTYTAEG